MTAPELTPQIVVVLTLLGFVVYLFVSEKLRVDIAALLILVLVGFISALPDMRGVLDMSDLFSGFSSGAVIAIMATMIIGAGLDRTGAMAHVATWVVRTGQQRESRMLLLLCVAVGLVSSFMQNVGAVALFLPVVSRISARTGVPVSRMLMPVGFCAILGGTITVVGSSPLIVLNDLLAHANELLPSGTRIEPFSLFSVTPVGIVLLVTGIAYFLLAGRWVLPAVEAPKEETEGSSAFAYFQKVYGLSPEIFELGVSPYSRAVDVRIDELEARHDVRIVGTHFKGRLRLSPPGDVRVEGPAILAVMGGAEQIKEFAGAYGLLLRPNLEHFAEALGRATSGISEVVIPPYSKHLGETLSDLRLRKRFGISVLAVHRGESSIRSGLADLPLQAGDTLVCHSTWEALARLDQDRNYVVVTSDYPHEDLRPQKFADAIFFLVVAMGLVLFVDIPLGLSLMAGALGMVMTGVLSMDEAYQSISWKTVFLLAGLFPLGKMVANSGAGAWIAYQAATLLGGMPVWVMQGAFVALATAFSLIMSNVGATVLLVPLAIQFALATGTDPAQFALLVALGACNSFFIPTNQVNALIMAPGGYKVRDFTRTGGIMTLLFIVVLVAMIDLFF